MQRWFLAGCAGFFITVIVSTARSDSPPPVDTSTTVSRLLALLSDVDPLVRVDAAHRLIILGESARPALRQAIPSADFQTRCQIDRVLLHIRWTRPGDSPELERSFVFYPDLDAGMRCGQVDNWPGQLGAAASIPLLRVLLCDPSAAVRWEAAHVLHMIVDEGDVTSKQLIDDAHGSSVDPDAYLPAAQNAPLLAAAAWAQRQSNPDTAADLFSKAVVIERDHPSAFRGQMDFVFQWLSDRAAAHKDYPLEVSLLRQQAARTPWDSDTVPDAVARLFAAHADYGPFPGLAGDLRCYKEYLAQPEAIYSLGRMLEQHNWPGVAWLADTVGLTLSGTSTDAHYRVGTFLAQRGWSDAAERELLWCVSLSNGRIYYAYFELSALAEDRDDDMAAAKYLEIWLKHVHEAGQMLQLDEFAAQVQWRYLRAYRLLHDRAAMQAHLDKLLDMDQQLQLLQKDPGMAADIVPALQELGRTGQANQIFDAAYQSLLDKISSTPADPMPKNNLAWLCACSGKKLDDAVKYSDQAVAQDPEDSACLDTQAEAYFRTGHATQAVQMESKALQFKPNDLYMQRQLQRFTSAATPVK